MTEEVRPSYPTMRVTFLDEWAVFNSPVDMYCPDCGCRTHNGVYALDDDDPTYYAVCRKCDWSMEGPADDYSEHFYYYFPELQSSPTTAKQEDE